MRPSHSYIYCLRNINYYRKVKVGTKSVSTYEGHQQMQLKCMSMIDDMVLHTYYNTKHISDKTKNKNKKNTKRISRLTSVNRMTPAAPTKNT